MSVINVTQARKDLFNLVNDVQNGEKVTITSKNCNAVLMSEDDYLLSEILFNPNTPEQLKLIQEKLAQLQKIVDAHDYDEMKSFLHTVRENLK